MYLKHGRCESGDCQMSQVYRNNHFQDIDNDVCALNVEVN